MRAVETPPANVSGTTETTVVADPTSFAALEGEWDDLLRDAPLATPYQSWAWLYSWWENYGGDHKLRLVAVREGGDLVGLIPLMLERRTGRLLFVGSGITNHLDLVVRAGHEERVALAGVGALRSMDSWLVADLWQLRSEAAAWHLYRAWNGYGTDVWQASCHTLDLGDGWDGLLSSLSQKFRGNVRRALRRAEGDGGRWEPAGPERAEEAAGTLVALHRESWEGREIGAEHLTRRFEDHLRAAARRMGSRGLGTVSEFRKDGEVISSHLVVSGQGLVEGYLGGATMEASRRYSVDALRVRDLASFAEADGLSHVSIGRGEESYKQRWHPKTESSRRVILARGAPAFAAYAGYHVLHAKARRYVNSDDAAPWVVKIADRYRSIRSTLGRLGTKSPEGGGR